MTIREARSLAGLWQARLGLTHWNVIVRWAKVGDELEPGDYGQVTWWTEEARAEILLRKDVGEATIIHELVHLVLEGARHTPLAYDASYERGINALVAALLR